MPHGMCFLWQPELLWLHVTSDWLIALAYYSIPIALIYFVSRRRDLAFRGIFVLTGLFILACGTTHILGAWTVWHPDYWADGAVKAFTAVVSIGTAVAMWRVMPLALALPSTSQLEHANRRLAGEIAERQRAEAALREVNAELERRVSARTAALQAEVAQRRHAEATLRASEARWRGVFETSAVGIAVTDQNQRFVAVNEAFQRMLGYTAEELRSRSPLDVTHQDDRAAAHALLDDVKDGRRSDYDVEKRYRRKDGTLIWVRISAARALDSASRLLGIPAIVEDITERKHAENALHETREALLRVTRLSTMGALSASIAHEINQPLAAINANATACKRLLAQASPDVEECQDAIGDIIGDANRASEVVKRVQGLSRNVAPQQEDIDVNDTIDEVLRLLRHELQKHRISVRTDLSPHLPPIRADRIQLQQVVLNLVMNGLEAMNPITERPRILTVRTRCDDPANVAVSVEDAGIGFDPANRERIFETFFTTKAHGMGMGLSICNTIIGAHHGRLWAAAGSPHGSVFGFTLPVAPVPA
jgi:PAS domain S-box-containing protein